MGNRMYSAEQVNELVDAMYTCIKLIERLKANEDLHEIFSEIGYQASFIAGAVCGKLPNQEEDQREEDKFRGAIYTLIISEPKYEAALQTLERFRDDIEVVGSLADKVNQLVPDLITQRSENPET